MQSPGVGITDVVDPALDAGVELSEGDVPVTPGVESLGEPLGGVNTFTALEKAVGGVDDEAEPGDAGGGCPMVLRVADWN